MAILGVGGAWMATAVEVKSANSCGHSERRVGMRSVLEYCINTHDR